MAQAKRPAASYSSDTELACVEISDSDEADAPQAHEPPAKRRHNSSVAAPFAGWAGRGGSDHRGEQQFVLEFTWRAQTLDTFFAGGAAASTQSAVATVDVRNAVADVWDALKFRMMLWPASPSEGADAAAAAAPAPQHRLLVQIVGGSGRTASQVYALAFRAIDQPLQALHMSVLDHRRPLYEAAEPIDESHPLRSWLKQERSVRMLLRVRPAGEEAGPLDDMLCGCC